MRLKTTNWRPLCCVLGVSQFYTNCCIPVSTSGGRSQLNRDGRSSSGGRRVKSGTNKVTSWWLQRPADTSRVWDWGPALPTSSIPRTGMPLGSGPGSDCTQYVIMSLSHRGRFFLNHTWWWLHHLLDLHPICNPEPLVSKKILQIFKTWYRRSANLKGWAGPLQPVLALLLPPLDVWLCPAGPEAPLHPSL